MPEDTVREGRGKTQLIAGGLVVASTNTISPKVQNAFARKGVKESDLLHLTYPLVHEGVNGNGDEFLREEMKRAYATLIGTPLDKDHEQDIDSIVGRHYAARYEEVGGEGVIICDAYVYASLYPDIAIKLIDGSIDGVSMEAKFAWAERTMGKRTLHEVSFLGAGLVRMPADNKARVSLRTASAHLNSYQRAALEIAVAALLAEDYA